MSSLNPKALFKYDWRLEKFLHNYKNSKPFTTVDGNIALLEYSNVTYNNLSNRIPQKLLDVNGNLISLSSLLKTEEFGGRGSNNGCYIEKQTILSIKKKIKDKNIKRIKVGDNFYNISDIENTFGTPKSDFHFTCASTNKPVCFISHKAGDTVRHFQQWSGMIDFQGHEEVRAFVETIRDNVNIVRDDRIRLWRNIECKDLQQLAVFGKDSVKSNEFGINNVNCVVQGSIDFNKHKDGYHELTGSNIFYNIDDLPEDYKPKLFVRYTRDRSSFGIDNVRFMIQGDNNGNAEQI